MNLYEIMIEHYAPKDSERGIYTYLIADSDESVYEWLKLESELKDGRRLWLSFSDCEEDGDTFEIYNDDYEVIGIEGFKERIIRLKGDMNDDEKSLDDLYYGATLVGWKTVKEDVSEGEYELLRNTGICVEKY